MNAIKCSKGSALVTLQRMFVLGLAVASLGTEAAVITGRGTWETTLQGRDAAGNPINMLNAAGDAPNPGLKYVYDTVLDLTWLADWNFNGNWSGAQAWAMSLTDFGGGWALPAVLDTNAPGCEFANTGTDCGYNVYGSEAERRNSPLAHMYYDTLGNLGRLDAFGNFQPDYGLKNSGPFSNMQAVYWSGTALAPFTAVEAWAFHLFDGIQDGSFQSASDSAVAVRRGDVFAGSVPEPGGLALLGLAFGALAVVRGRTN